MTIQGRPWYDVTTPYYETTLTNHPRWEPTKPYRTRTLSTARTPTRSQTQTSRRIWSFTRIPCSNASKPWEENECLRALVRYYHGLQVSHHWTLSPPHVDRVPRHAHANMHKHWPIPHARVRWTNHRRPLPYKSPMWDRKDDSTTACGAAVLPVQHRSFRLLRWRSVHVWPESKHEHPTNEENEDSNHPIERY